MSLTQVTVYVRALHIEISLKQLVGILCADCIGIVHSQAVTHCKNSQALRLGRDSKIHEEEA